MGKTRKTTQIIELYRRVRDRHMYNRTGEERKGERCHQTAIWYLVAVSPHNNSQNNGTNRQKQRLQAPFILTSSRKTKLPTFTITLQKESQ
jgi:hypothetical protein